MEHSIFKSIVTMYDQADCDIAREICERYELPVWNNIELAFDYVDYEDDDPTYLRYQTKESAGDDDHIGFYIDNIDEEDEANYTIVSIQEFEALAEDYNPQFKSVDDILSKMKELNNLLNSK
jgi:hypothetical protein